ncbi:hypothetical protein [Vibrio owensii]|uniref:hypothetical protein n=1 Tax=Vibrio owensii TaxID=696485 RepID=UPI0040680585
MSSKTGGNTEAEKKLEASLIQNKRNTQSLEVVKKLLPQLSHTRNDVLQMLGINEGGAITKVYKLLGNKTLEAHHVVVPYDAFKNYTDDDPKDSKVAVHRLNKRNQKALDRTALSDLVDSAKEFGIHDEGLAVEVNGRYEIIDSSRRFGAARFAECDLPLWVFPEGTELSDSEIRLLAHITTIKRSLSYREEGKHIVDFAYSLGTDKNASCFKDAVISTFNKKLSSGSLDTKKSNFPVLEEGESFPYELMVELVNFKEVFYEAIRLEFGLTCGDKTITRYLDAANVSDALILLFPDYESIDNKKYQKLKKASRLIATKLGKPFKTNVDNELVYYKEIEPLVESWLKGISDQLNVDEQLPINEQHDLLIAQLNEFLVEKEVVEKSEPTWSEPLELSRKGKDKYSTIRSHKNGRVHELKLTRPTDRHLNLHKLIATKFDSLDEETVQSLLDILGE